MPTGIYRNPVNSCPVYRVSIAPRPVTNRALLHSQTFLRCRPLTPVRMASQGLNPHVHPCVAQILHAPNTTSGDERPRTYHLTGLRWRLEHCTNPEPPTGGADQQSHSRYHGAPDGIRTFLRCYEVKNSSYLFLVMFLFSPLRAVPSILAPSPFFLRSAFWRHHLDRFRLTVRERKSQHSLSHVLLQHLGISG
jgi:hypothetical protein